MTKGSSADGVIFSDFLGTGFLIGDQGFALTAAHILTPQNLAGCFVVYDQWTAIAIKTYEIHDDLDVAILHLADGGPKRSPFRCRNNWEGSGRKYRQFGYPRHVVWERQADTNGRVLPNLELIYTEGYIRRRVSVSLDIKGVNGAEFFEVSTQAGKGCSGSPLFVQSPDNAWDLIGIYVAERTTEDEDGDRIGVSYAIREEGFRNWRPELLAGLSILEESRKVDLTCS